MGDDIFGNILAAPSDPSDASNPFGAAANVGLNSATPQTPAYGTDFSDTNSPSVASPDDADAPDGDGALAPADDPDANVPSPEPSQIVAGQGPSPVTDDAKSMTPDDIRKMVNSTSGDTFTAGTSTAAENAARIAKEKASGNVPPEDQASADARAVDLEHSSEPQTPDDIRAMVNAKPPPPPEDNPNLPLPEPQEFSDPEAAAAIQSYDAGNQYGGGSGLRVKGGALVRPSPTLDQRANAEGVSVNGASAGAQVNAQLMLGQLDPTDPNDEAFARQAVAAAISKDTGKDFPISNVKIGPITHQMEWLPPGATRWDLFSGTGVTNALVHMRAALPDVINQGTEALGGVAGALAGSASPLGPGYTTAAGGIMGAGIARGFSTLVALHAARDKGLTDMSDDEMFARAMTKTMQGVRDNALGGLAFGMLRRAALGIWGFDAALSRKVGSWQAIQDGLKAAAGFKSTAKSALGVDIDFPLTTGRAAGASEALREGTVFSHTNRNQPFAGDAARSAERALMNEGRDSLREPIADVYQRQRAAMETVQRATFAADPVQAVDAGNSAMEAAISAEKKSLASDLSSQQAAAASKAARDVTDEVEGVKGTITSRAVEPTYPMQAARLALKAARDEQFDRFREIYDGIQANTGIRMNLASFRQAAEKLKATLTQPIMSGVGVTASGERVLKKAANAGLDPGLAKYLEENIDDPEWGDLAQEIKGTYAGEEYTLGDVMKLRSGLKAAYRDAKAVPGKGRMATLFKGLSNALDKTIAESGADPQTLDLITHTDASYRDTMTRFNYGLVSKLISDDGRGSFDLADNSAIDHLLGGATTADTFMDALFSPSDVNAGTGMFERLGIPQAGNILLNVQRAVLGRIAQRFVDRDSGQIINPKGFNQWVNEHYETLDRLLTLSADETKAAPQALNIGAKALTHVAGLAKASSASMDGVKAVAQDMAAKYGVYDGNGAHMIDIAVARGQLSELGNMQSIISQHLGPQGVTAFRSALGAKSRELMAGNDGLIDPDKVESFLASKPGQSISAVMGKQWTQGVKLVGQMARVMDMGVSSQASQEMASTITREHKSLYGIYRAIRVFVPPLSEHSRVLTAVLGSMNDRAKARISQMLADPEKLQELQKFAQQTRNPFAVSTRQMLGRLGMNDVSEFWDQQRQQGRAVPGE